MPDIDFGQMSEALNNKTDRDMRNVDTTAKADAVIDYQEPTAENNYTWYRKYKSGWVEQGGAFATVNTNYHRETVVLPIEMSNTSYTCNVSCASTGSAYMTLIETKSTTGFIMYNVINNVAYSATWFVAGMAA